MASLGAGEITAIVSAVTAVVGAISTFIYKIRGRSWREIFKSVMEGKSEEFKELADVTKAQAKALEKVMAESKSKKK